MKTRSLKYYSQRYLFPAILGIITLWAGSFYWLIVEEVHDNIDDGLKLSEKRILSAIERNPELLNTREYDLAQFKITPLPPGTYSYKTHIFSGVIQDEDDQNDTDPVRILHTIFDHGEQTYELEIYASTMENNEFLGNLLVALLVLYVLLVISLFIINYFMLGKAWRPFYRFLRKLNSYKIGSENPFKEAHSEIKEFQDLQRVLSSMIERNETLYEQQKQFIGNAAHELQTPLSIAGNKLEMLMQDPHLAENQLVQINEVHETLTRLKRLNKALLMLSRIESGQFSTPDVINLNAVFRQSIDDFQPLISYKQIHIEEELTSVFQVEMNPDLAVILVNNLLKNAIVHSPEKGSIKISGSSTYLQIQNPGTKTLDGERIFNRFYKESKHRDSTGLGLATIQSIIKLYPELEIGYHFSNGQHIFTLKRAGAL